MRPNTFKTLAWLGFTLVLLGTVYNWAYSATHTQRMAQQAGGATEIKERPVGEPSMTGDRVGPPGRTFALPAWVVFFFSFWCAIATSNPKTSFEQPLFCCSFGLLQSWANYYALPETPNTAASSANWILLAGFATQLLGVIAKDRQIKRAASAAKQQPPIDGRPD